MKIRPLYSRFLLSIALGLSSSPFAVRAQQTIRGVVLDAANEIPVEIANVLLFEGTGTQPIIFTLTGPDGTFSIPAVNRDDSLQIQISLLGYKPVRLPVRPGDFVRIPLEQQPFALKEVEIRPGRVWGRQDTIHYDVSRFLSPKDEAIKDVLKKMPGIDVDEMGKISYNGKNINKFYVEGMDLTDGRYSRINNNLPAKAVKEVQVLENHQPIRALQKKIRTEDIALNLKLKPEFRDRWMGSLEGGLGASPLLWKGEGDALQLGRKSQSIYLYKGNNKGEDVTGEQNILTPASFLNTDGPAIPAFLSQPSFSAPLKKERTLFNRVHTLSANRLYKLDETVQLRVNAQYIHDRQRQTRGTETRYYQATDTVAFLEQSQSRLRTDQADVSLDLENNAENHFLTNRFNLTGRWETGASVFAGSRPMAQRLETPDMGIRNYLQNVWVQKTYTLEVRSLLRYHDRKSRLRTANELQEMDFRQLYLDHSFSFIKKRGRISQHYTGGIRGDINNIRNGMQLYFRTGYQTTRGKWKTTFAVPLQWALFPQAGFSRWAPNPSLFVQYKWNYAWRFEAFASYGESYGEVLCFYPGTYRTDYRNRIHNNGFLPVYRHQNYSLNGEFKNTVNEFFATLSVAYYRGWSNRTDEQVAGKEEVAWIAHARSSHSDSWTLHGTVSKGFFDQGLKTSLDYRFGLNRGEQLSRGEKLSYRTDYMEYEPKVSWTPFRRLETGYHATVRYGGSRIGTGTHLQPLLDVVQKLYVSYELTPIEAHLSLDHYHNDVSETQAVNAFFADLSLRWKTGNWQFTAEATNLFDKKEYRYTQYSATESYTSWVRIRPREFMATLKYKF